MCFGISRVVQVDGRRKMIRDAPGSRTIRGDPPLIPDLLAARSDAADGPCIRRFVAKTAARVRILRAYLRLPASGSSSDS